MNKEQRSFLKKWKAAEGEIHPEAIPIFCEDDGGDPFFTGAACVGGGKSRAKFIAEAPKGLWLGGGAVMIYVPQGIVTVPDRRHGGNAGPAAQGWARYDEGEDLSQAADREFQEEITAYVLSGEGDNVYQPCTGIVPKGISPKEKVRSLNLTLDDSMTYGEVRFLAHCRNEQDRAWIWVGLWDLRDLPNANRLRIVWDDDFPQDRHPGTNPRVLSFETGREVGRFEGIQGYLRNDLSFHPVLQQAI